jgi:tetratricopeptide (TPR) repeat protein
MLRDQAMILYHTGRLDEAIAFYDGQIAAAKDPRSRAYFMQWKANTLLATDRHEQTIATCRELRSTEIPQSEEWAEATAFLGTALQNGGHHGEAILVYREQISRNRQTGSSEAFPLLAIARSQRALGLDDDAARTLDEVENALSSEVDRPAKQKQNDNLRQELQKARESLKKSQ